MAGSHTPLATERNTASGPCACVALDSTAALSMKKPTSTKTPARGKCET